MASGLIAWPATHSLTVHPLQLYFVVAGVIVAVFCAYSSRSGHRDGSVWVYETGTFCACMLILEQLRGFVLYLDMLVYGVGLVTTLVIVAQRWRSEGYGFPTEACTRSRGLG